MKKFLQTTESNIAKASRALAIFCLFVVFILFILNILIRFFPFYNPKWIDETIQFFLVWMIFLTAMELTRTGQHFVVDILTEKIEDQFLGRLLNFISSLLSFLALVIICYCGFYLCSRSTSGMVTLTFMKQSYFYFCIPFTSFFMSIYAFRDTVLAAIKIFNPHSENRKDKAP